MQKYYLIIPLAVAVGFLIFPFMVYYGNDIMVVTSDSMLPTLKPHDLIIVKEVSIDEIQVGDIIAFGSYSEQIDIIAHRVIAIGKDEDGKLGIDTKGDNVDAPDPWTIYDENIVGEVIDVLPFMGILLIEPVRYSLVAIIVIMSVSLLWDFYKEQNPKASN